MLFQILATYESKEPRWLCPEDLDNPARDDDADEMHQDQIQGGSQGSVYIRSGGDARPVERPRTCSQAAIPSVIAFLGAIVFLVAFLRAPDSVSIWTVRTERSVEWLYLLILRLATV